MNYRCQPFSDSARSAKPRGRLDLTVRSPGGLATVRRRAQNIVLRGGAELVAGLFAGVEGAGPIDRVRIGFGLEAVSAEATSLTPPEDGNIPASTLETALTRDSFVIESDRPGLVSVAINAFFSPTLELQNVSEAALAANDRLYNQVVFEPITLRVGQDVTFFWQIEFPFG